MSSISVKIFSNTFVSFYVLVLLSTQCIPDYYVLFIISRFSDIGDQNDSVIFCPNYILLGSG